jgi:endonuclease-3
MKPRTPKGRARALVGELARLYPDARCSLDFATPVQLLVATILSAQCTDACVNKITPALFARFPDAHALAAARPEELEALVHKSGFFRNKAKNIIRCCTQLVDRHGGEVPRTLEELVPLAGIGRKTANVVLTHAFDAPGLAVDTHVARLSKRLGLTASKNPVVIERELCALLPRKDWALFGLRLIYHGRKVCRARRPRCEQCALAGLCPKVGVGPGGKTALTPVKATPLTPSPCSPPAGEGEGSKKRSVPRKTPLRKTS